MNSVLLREFALAFLIGLLAVVSFGCVVPGGGYGYGGGGGITMNPTVAATAAGVLATVWPHIKPVTIVKTLVAATHLRVHTGPPLHRN